MGYKVIWTDGVWGLITGVYPENSFRGFRNPVRDGMFIETELSKTVSHPSGPGGAAMDASKAQKPDSPPRPARWGGRDLFWFVRFYKHAISDGISDCPIFIPRDAQTGPGILRRTLNPPK